MLYFLGSYIDDMFIGPGDLSMSDLQIQYVSPDRLRPYPGNARSHSASSSS